MLYLLASAAFFVLASASVEEFPAARVFLQKVNLVTVSLTHLLTNYLLTYSLHNSISLFLFVQSTFTEPVVESKEFEITYLLINSGEM
jgi:hypothetical protein